MNNIYMHIVVSVILILLGIIIIFLNKRMISTNSNKKNPWIYHIFIILGLLLTVCSSIYFETIIRQWIIYLFTGYENVMIP